MKSVDLLLFSSIITFSVSEVHAQAMNGSTSIEKENREAMMINIAQTADITSDALEQKMKRAGVSGKSHGDVTIYKAVILSDISPEKVDIYTKVVKNKDKTSCTVFMSVSKGYENFATPGTDKQIFENMKNFLNTFVKDVMIYSLDLKLADKLDEVKKEEKRYDNLVDDEKDLQKDKVNIENKIVNKLKEIKDKKEEVAKRKEELEKLKEQRSKLN
jgi:hypothetical protein